MATQINLLDRAPQVVIRSLNWALAALEDPVGLDRPRWKDSSRYQGQQDFLLQAANGVWGNVFRQGISWGYQDPTFAQNWGESDGVLRYRSSYHVIYPDQQVKPQFENWVKYHPQIGFIPRVIDLELQRETAPAVIANQVWEMSERVADHDGVRPLIYSRYTLINTWLSPYWSPVMLNEHYYILAQYLWDRTREHPGPPTLPNGVARDRVVMQQTADKKAAPGGESESYTNDWDRWELGNAEQMQQWIANTWGGAPLPPPLTLEERVERLEEEVFGA